MFYCIVHTLYLRLLRIKLFDSFETNSFGSSCSISIIVKIVFHNIIQKYVYIFKIQKTRLKNLQNKKKSRKNHDFAGN